MPSFQKPSFGKPRSWKASTSSGPSPDEAEAIGLAALLFMTEDENRLSRFLSETGISPGELGAAAGSADMLCAVLDFVLADESLLLVFASHAAIDPAVIAPASATLSGAKR